MVDLTFKLWGDHNYRSQRNRLLITRAASQWRRMIKRIIGPEHKIKSPGNEHWLTLDTIAQVELTSEEMGIQIESGLLPNTESGWDWEAAQPGPRRCVFSLNGHRITHVHLEFQEYQSTRTQEFVLRWSSNGGRSSGGPARGTLRAVISCVSTRISESQ